MLTQSTNSFLPWCKNLAILHKFLHIWSSDCAFFPSWFSCSHRPILQELWKDIGDGLMWKVKPWAYFFILIARRPEGNYFFPLWNRGNVACHRSQLTIFQYEKPFAQAANWNLNQNLKLAWSKLPIKIPTLRDNIAKWRANEQPVSL